MRPNRRLRSTAFASLILVSTAAWAACTGGDDGGTASSGGTGGDVSTAGNATGGGQHGGGVSAAAGGGGSAGASAHSAGGQVAGGGMNVGGGADAGGGGAASAMSDQSVLEHHKNKTRDGVYHQTQITKDTFSTLALEKSFAPSLDGNTYAQLLYLEGQGGSNDLVLAVTENNSVQAINAITGATAWSQSLGTPAGQSGSSCGNVLPLGITGTPVIDPTTRTMYLDAMIAVGNGRDHRIYALHADTGEVVDGWPISLSAKTFASFNDPAFLWGFENQRGALALVGGRVYLPYGGHSGDCDDYHGIVVSVSASDPNDISIYATPNRGSGMWAPGGLATDGTDIFASVGNSELAPSSDWHPHVSNAILRLGAGATFSDHDPDFFAPSDWAGLDSTDADLGGSGPILFDVAGSTPSALVVALGKNGVVYLLDRANLGGVGKGDGQTGEGVTSLLASSGAIITAGAAYTTPVGSFVVFNSGGDGVGCPAGQSGSLIAVQIKPRANMAPELSVAWCADAHGKGAPMVTTTDPTVGTHAIVWVVGAEGDNQLHGYDGNSGSEKFDGSQKPDKITRLVRRFSTPIAAKNRIFVNADGGVYAFSAP